MVRIDGPDFQAEVAGVDARGQIAFRIADAKDKSGVSRTLPLDEIVRWGNPVVARPQTIVVLADGGQIVTAADWAGGAAVKLAGDDVVLLSDTWNEVRLRRNLVSGVVFSQQSRAEDRERLVERVRKGQSAEPSLAAASSEQPGPVRQSSLQASLKGRVKSDVVFLTNGDRVEGRITKLDRGSLSIESLGGTADLPLSRVEEVLLGRDDHEPSLKGKGKLVVGMRDGSLVFANAIKANEKVLDIELADGVKLTGGEVDDVVFLQSLGGRFVYLSDLEGGDYRHVPYLTVTWPYTRDRNVLGEPIVVRGKRYLKGIGMHSASRLTYRLEGDYQRFNSAIALDDSAKGRGSVTFGVYVSREGKWVEAYKSGVVRGQDAPVPVSIDLHGAKGITLTVDYADRGDELDHAAWLDARLVR